MASHGCNNYCRLYFLGYHEVNRGVFDFVPKTAISPNLSASANRKKCKVLFRPGPYVVPNGIFGGTSRFPSQHPEYQDPLPDPRYMKAGEHEERRAIHPDPSVRPSSL